MHLVHLILHSECQTNGRTRNAVPMVFPPPVARVDPSPGYSRWLPLGSTRGHLAVERDCGTDGGKRKRRNGRVEEVVSNDFLLRIFEPFFLFCQVRILMRVY